MQHNTFKTEKNPLDIEGAITGIALLFCLILFICTVLYSIGIYKDAYPNKIEKRK